MHLDLSTVPLLHKDSTYYLRGRVGKGKGAGGGGSQNIIAIIK